MPRFYFEFTELEGGTAGYCINDRRLGSDEYIALCARSDDAQKIVDALNAYKPPALGVFG
jgi:hypothetical protein